MSYFNKIFLVLLFGVPMLRLFYHIFFTIAAFLSAPYWLIRGLFKPGTLSNLKARFQGSGKIFPKKPETLRVLVWALSFGEVLSARVVIEKLLKRGVDVILGASTRTGLALARQNYPQLTIVPTPLDLKFSINRFLDSINPDHVILVETDIWPQFLWELEARKIKKSLISGRLSPRSFKNYYRFRFFWKKVFNIFDTLALQSKLDQERFLAIGVDPTKLKVTGNIKFDEAMENFIPEERSQILQETGLPPGRYLIVGSTHLGEERLICEAVQDYFSIYPDLKLVIAPRDTFRFEQVYRFLAEKYPLETLARRSQGPLPLEEIKIFLLDTLGELKKFYALGELAIIGKSFPGTHEGGGHNPLEPAALGIPVITGPRIHNFMWVYETLADLGATLIVKPEQLSAVLGDLLAHPEKSKTMGQKAQSFVKANLGASQKTLEFIAPNLFTLS
ncbi:MAG: hypothetical protein LBF22_08725 [Deltaproteobacteria bacterium]|jgi:3-deoxy-D-manno-octulosonic-acid transferase|nr:hypothetical protein [Deltaproteobacteria bacterium]